MTWRLHIVPALEGTQTQNPEILVGSECGMFRDVLVPPASVRRLWPTMDFPRGDRRSVNTGTSDHVGLLQKSPVCPSEVLARDSVKKCTLSEDGTKMPLQISTLLRR